MVPSSLSLSRDDCETCRAHEMGPGLGVCGFGFMATEVKGYRVHGADRVERVASFRGWALEYNDSTEICSGSEAGS